MRAGVIHPLFVTPALTGVACHLPNDRFPRAVSVTFCQFAIVRTCRRNISGRFRYICCKGMRIAFGSPVTWQHYFFYSQWLCSFVLGLGRGDAARVEAEAIGKD